MSLYHLYNIFDSKEEAIKAAEHDICYQKAIMLSIISDVDLKIIMGNRLFEESADGGLLLDDYLTKNNLSPEFPEIYNSAKKIEMPRIRIYKYGNKFVFRRSHSDKKYETSKLNHRLLIRRVSW